MTKLNLQAAPEQLLRPHQVTERLEEKAGIQEMLGQPAFIQNQIQDRGAMIRRLRNIETSLEQGVPKSYDGAPRLDNAVAEELRLRELLSSTMLSKDEMMKNPDGASDKLIRWEKDYKPDVLKWKNLRLRLHASGVDFGYDNNVANLEVYRPGSRDSDLNINKGAQIERKTAFHFGADPANTVAFSDADIERIAELAPELVTRLFNCSNFERKQIRNALDDKDPMDGLEMPGKNSDQDVDASGGPSSQPDGKSGKK